MPTVINNAETLSSVPYILANGSDAFHRKSARTTTKGTKIISLSGAVTECEGWQKSPMGTTLREIIYEIGGGLHDDRQLTAIAVGGPSSGIFPVSMLDTPLKPGFIHESGVMLGAGGVIALDDSVSVVDMMRKLAAYNADESCGKCTPCREGTPRMVEMVDRLDCGQGVNFGPERPATARRAGERGVAVRAGAGGWQSGAERAALLRRRTGNDGE